MLAIGRVSVWTWPASHNCCVFHCRTCMQTATHICKLPHFAANTPLLSCLQAQSNAPFCHTACTATSGTCRICCDAVQYKHECIRMSSLEGRLNTAVSMTAASSQGHNRYAGVSWTATAVQSAACKRYSLSQALCGPMNHIVQ